MNSSYFDFKKLIFPHLEPNIKQKKEMKFIYCYNFRYNGEINPHMNEEFMKYMQDVSNFVKRTNKKLVSHEMDNLKVSRLLRYEFMEREKSENSSFFEIRPVPTKEIDDLNSFLISTGYKKKYDKFGYFYEGCINDQKVFIGGKSQLISHYCRNFFNIPVCKQIREAVSRNYVDRRLGFNNDETTIDSAMDEFIKLFEK